MAYSERVIEQTERLEDAEPSCRHHWVIDSPAGPVSQGACRICGEERAFKNFIDGSYWEDDVSLGEVSTGGRYPASLAGVAGATLEDA